MKAIHQEVTMHCTTLLTLCLCPLLSLAAFAQTAENSSDTPKMERAPERGGELVPAAADSEWKVVNMGAPINSEYQAFYILPE